MSLSPFIYAANIGETSFGKLNSGITDFPCGSFPKNFHVTIEYIVKNNNKNGKIIIAGLERYTIFSLSTKVGLILSVFKFSINVSPFLASSSFVEMCISSSFSKMS